jgi:UDP-N-acetylglucosamine 2-epimerase (non-hydrolysing)
MKIMSVVGARPNFMKVAPIIAAVTQHNDAVTGYSPPGAGKAPPAPIHHVLVHTGQHYDQLMSDSFFADLKLPRPDVHLGVGSGSHAAQTAEIMKRFEDVLLREKPDLLVVVGDVNSTLACALVAAKISFDGLGTRPLIAHVEAGLRSFDRTMPEEINRILADELSDLLFVSEKSGLRNLAREGVPAERVHFVGNTMIDSLLAYNEKAETSTILDDLGLRVANNGSGLSITPYALLTLHRPANVDRRDVFLNIVEGLEELSRQYAIVFPAHPRTRKRVRDYGLEPYFASNGVQHELDAPNESRRSGTIRMIEPVGYLDFLCLMKNASLVVTDSGGIQEETTCLGVPCVTVRENTERPVTLEIGTNVLAGVSEQGIREAVRRQLLSRTVGTVPDLWDGESSVRILSVLIHEFERRLPLSESSCSPSSTPSTPVDRLDHPCIPQKGGGNGSALGTLACGSTSAALEHMKAQQPEIDLNVAARVR